MRRGLMAIALVVGVSAAARASEWWTPYRSDASGVMNACTDISPATVVAVLTRDGFKPSYTERTYGVDVIYHAANGEELFQPFFHSYELCQRAVQIFIDQANKYK